MKIDLRIRKTIRKVLGYNRAFVKPCVKANNYKGGEKVCIILAGYKDYLWDVFFTRLVTYCPQDIEICIISSGLFSKRLLSICEDHSWTYLAYKRNCITQALNSSIRFFENAKYFYKIDEDIFLTEGAFSRLYDVYFESMSKFRPAFSAPLIPVNGFGYSYILDIFNKKDEYSSSFEPPIMCIGDEYSIVSNPEAAKFMWEGIGLKIDTMNSIVYDMCHKHPNTSTFIACPIRFSIGFIFFERSTIEKYGGFPVQDGNCMGLDEVFLCNLATSYARAIIVAQDTIVGHLSFGRQAEAMKLFFEKNIELFTI